MARVNITLPDDLVVEARAAGLTLSTYAAQGIRERLRTLAQQAELERYLAQLDAEHGPVSPEGRAAAERWLDDAGVPRPDAAAGAAAA